MGEVVKEEDTSRGACAACIYIDILVISNSYYKIKMSKYTYMGDWMVLTSHPSFQVYRRFA